MPLPDILGLAVTAFVLIVVPGPSVLFVVSRGGALGRRAALATVVGNAGGSSRARETGSCGRASSSARRTRRA